MPSLNGLLCCFPSRQPRAQAEGESSSVKSWAKNITKVRQSASTLYKNEMSILTTRLYYYTTTLNADGVPNTTRNKRLPSSLGMKIRQVFCSFFPCDARIRTINAKLRQEMRLEKEAAAIEARGRQSATTANLNNSISGNAAATILMKKLEKLLDSITCSMESAANKKRLDELQDAHRSLNDMRESVQKKCVCDASGGFDAALRELSLAVDSHYAILQRTSRALEILNDLYEQVINEHTNLAMVFTDLKNFNTWFSSYPNPFFTAILKWTGIGRKTETTEDALKDETSVMKKMIINRLNELLPPEQQLSVKSTPLDICSNWIAAHKAKITANEAN